MESSCSGSSPRNRVCSSMKERKNRSSRKSEPSESRSVKHARNVRGAVDELRRAIPSAYGSKLSKVRTLRAAMQYIQDLTALLHPTASEDLRQWNQLTSPEHCVTAASNNSSTSMVSCKAVLASRRACRTSIDSGYESDVSTNTPEWGSSSSPLDCGPISPSFTTPDKEHRFSELKMSNEVRGVYYHL